MIKKKIYIWASDYSNFTGEGNLGRLFVNLKLKNKYKIILCKFETTNNMVYKIFGYKYILPILGILNCWKYFLKGKNICYLNYLPLWNSLIFLLLPPKTILGPITGGSHFKKEISINYFIRKFIFPKLYKLSLYMLFARKFNPIFSTKLLIKYLSKNQVRKSEFNFVLNALNLKKNIKKKKLQFLIYYKKHQNKLNLYPLELIKNLLKLKYKILVIGDELKIEGIKNLGYLNRNKLKRLLVKSKYAIISNENLYSFFTIECLNTNMKIITTKRKNQIDKILREKFIYINPRNISEINIKKNF